MCPAPNLFLLTKIRQLQAEIGLTWQLKNKESDGSSKAVSKPVIGLGTRGAKYFQDPWLSYNTRKHTIQDRIEVAIERRFEKSALARHPTESFLDYVFQKIR